MTDAPPPDSTPVPLAAWRIRRWGMAFGLWAESSMTRVMRVDDGRLRLLVAWEVPP